MFNLVLGTMFVFGTLMVMSLRTASVTMAPMTFESPPPRPAGSQIYTMKCAKCHNAADPTKPGPIGPDIANSSFDLLKAKTQFRTYPPNYVPKRKTRIMPIIKMDDESIRALEAFLKREKK